MITLDNPLKLERLFFHLNNNEFCLRKHLEYAEKEFDDIRKINKLKQQNKIKRKERKEKRKPDEEGWIKV